MWEFPGGPVVSVISLQRVWVQSLAEELRSQGRVAKKQKNLKVKL